MSEIIAVAQPHRHSPLSHAAHETQAECLLLEVMAEARIAKEYDAAQERGEVEKAGGDRKSIIPRASGIDRPPTMHLENEATWTPEFKAAARLSELGLDSRRLSEWRRTAEAGEDVVRQAVNDALDEGRAAEGLSFAAPRVVQLASSRRILARDSSIDRRELAMQRRSLPSDMALVASILSDERRAAFDCLPHSSRTLSNRSTAAAMMS